MAQLVASVSGVVLGGVAEVVGSNLARGKYLPYLSAQLIHYIPPYCLNLHQFLILCTRVVNLGTTTKLC